MYVARLEEADKPEEFGYKAAVLSGMLKMGMPVPKGFVIKPGALELFISSNNLEDKLKSVSGTAGMGLAGLRSIDKKVKEMFLNASVPDDVKKSVSSAYRQLSLADELRHADAAALDLIRAGREQERVALRSSVIRGAKNSFAGVTSAFLNACGEEELWSRIKLCWASLFSPFALLYGENRGVTGLPRMSIVVQRMVDSEKSGSMMTNFGSDKMLIEATWGLGNALSSGIVTPDEYLLEKNGSMIEKNISKKLWMYVRNPMSGKTEREHVPGSKMDAQVLTDPEMRKLCELGEKLLSNSPGQNVVDWCIARNRVFILDCKPGNYEISVPEEEQAGDVLVTGRCASPGTASGTISPYPGESGGQPQAGSIIVSENPSVTTLISIPEVAGFVTDEGGRLCNFGVLARELGIPALTATQNATSILHIGDNVRLIAGHGKVFSITGIAPAIQGEGEGLEFPLPIEPMEKQMLDYERPASGTRIFTRLSAGSVEKTDGADGFVLLNSCEDADAVFGADVENIRNLGGKAVWLRSKSEGDFSGSVCMSKKLDESGFSGIGIIVPITRGVNDLERWRYQIPASAKLGVEIKTPAMALTAGSFVKDGISMADIELKSLVQLSMGLARPDTEIHRAVLDMIENVLKRCREIGAKVCISIGSDYLTDENIESLVRLGVDIVCVEPDKIKVANDVLTRAEKKILLERNCEKESPEHQSETENTSESDGFNQLLY